MENKTKEQLADERYKEFSTPLYNGMTCIQKQAFIEGWDARKPEIDALTPKWISVEDRLPEHGQIVLLYSDTYTNITTGDYSYSLQCFRKHNKADFGIITHWMPLPNPPKQNHEKNLNLKTMKNSPEEYADELIDWYVRKLGTFGFVNFKSIAIQCAINDVTNTLDALAQTGIADTGYYKIFEQALTILKSKI